MSYEKQTWVTGEVITSTKLNHIEDGIRDCDIKCFSVENNPVTLFECTGAGVTSGPGANLYTVDKNVVPRNLVLDDDELTITINGTVYQSEKKSIQMAPDTPPWFYYGGSPADLMGGDFTIPFCYSYAEGVEDSTMFIVTENTTYDIKMEAEKRSVVPTDDFKEAVNIAAPSTTLVLRQIPESNPMRFDKTGTEVINAIKNGTICVAFVDDGNPSEELEGYYIMQLANAYEHSDYYEFVFLRLDNCNSEILLSDEVDPYLHYSSI